MYTTTIAEQLYFITVLIETERIEKTSPIIGLGTGFIVSYAWENEKEEAFLVTNRHVVEGVQKVRFSFIQSDGENPLLKEVHNIQIFNSEKAWFFHPDKDIDIAIMPLGVILKRFHDEKKAIFFKSISKNISPSPEQKNDIDAIEEIVFVGYPSGIYDCINHLPIIRKGCTATPINIDYNGKPYFLVDASIFPGSSGSPVFIFNKGSYSTKKNGLFLGDRLMFVGVISEVYTRTDDGIWSFTNVPTVIAPIVKTQQMIDLGIVIKADKVFETIEDFLKSKRDKITE